MACLLPERRRPLTQGPAGYTYYHIWQVDAFFQSGGDFSLKGPPADPFYPPDADHFAGFRKVCVAKELLQVVTRRVLRLTP